MVDGAVTRCATLDEKDTSVGGAYTISPWKKTVDVLEFRLGPWVLGRWRFAALINNISAVNERVLEIPQVDIPVTYYHARYGDDKYKTISLRYDVIRYISRRDVRYFIETLNTNLDKYLLQFSKKMRGNLKRQLKYFSRESGGPIDFRHCRSAEEMADFCKHAETISRSKHQSKISWNLSDFDGQICGFLLMSKDEPTAYALCTIEGDILVYQYTEYNPKYAKLSPGTVLFLLIMAQIFSDTSINFVDIGASRTWKYKESFATGSVEYVTIHWFPNSLSHLLMILIHYIVTNLWGVGARLKRIVGAIYLPRVGTNNL